MGLWGAASRSREGSERPGVLCPVQRAAQGISTRECWKLNGGEETALNRHEMGGRHRRVKIQAEAFSGAVPWSPHPQVSRISHLLMPRRGCSVSPGGWEVDLLVAGVLCGSWRVAGSQPRSPVLLPDAQAFRGVSCLPGGNLGLSHSWCFRV